jgi:hypothetical protein
VDIVISSDQYQFEIDSRSDVTGNVTSMTFPSNGMTRSRGLLQFQWREFDVENGRYTGHEATFSNSLVFGSPGTGLMRFDSGPEKTLRAAASKSGTMPQAEEGVGLRVKVRDLTRGAERRIPDVILLTLAFLSQSLTLAVSLSRLISQVYPQTIAA